MTRTLRMLAARLHDERGMALVLAIGIVEHPRDRGRLARPLQHLERAPRVPFAHGRARVQPRADRHREGGRPDRRCRRHRRRRRRRSRRPGDLHQPFGHGRRRRRSAAASRRSGTRSCGTTARARSTSPRGPFYIPELRWHVTSTSTVPNPAVPGGTMTRQLQSDVLLAPERHQEPASEAWRYIYSKRDDGDPPWRRRAIRAGGLRHHAAEQPERRRLVLRHRRPLPGEQQPDHRQGGPDPDRGDRARLDLQRLAAGLGRHVRESD